MNPYLLRAADLGPKAVEKILHLIPKELYDNPSADRFTVREVLAHLADWEPIFRDRMVQARLHPGCSVEVFDEGERAKEMAYGSQDVFTSLETWAQERRKTIDFLRTLSNDDFSKPLMHPENGAMRLEDVANMLLGHDLYHVEQLAEYL